MRKIFFTFLVLASGWWSRKLCFVDKYSKRMDLAENQNNLHRPHYNCFGNCRLQYLFTAQCTCSRLSCLFIIIIVIVLIYINDKYTYVLNFNSYLPTQSRMEGHQPSETWSSKNLLKLSSESESRTTGKTTNTIEVDDWHRITNGTYAYSAYWDDRFHSQPFIRIVAGFVVANGYLSDLKCLVRITNTTNVYEEASATYEILKEHHSKSSRAIYIICSPTKTDLPDSVSVVLSSWNKTWTSELRWMKVHLIRDVHHTPSQLGLCVRPLFNNYTDVFRIVEFVAYYEALGVDHFVFYNFDSVHEIEQLIALLRYQNYLVELLPWNLPSVIEDMWSVGQIASINDCLYRQMATASYVVVVDLDEFMTPRHVLTLPQLLSDHDIPGRDFSSFVFKSCIFCDEYQQDILPDVIPPFVTQSNWRRENKIYPFFVRSKYVAKPRHVVAGGIHFIWDSMPGAERRLVSSSHMMVHHYRKGLCERINGTLEKGEIDPMSRKYLNQIMRSRALSIWNDYFIPKRHNRKMHTSIK